MRMKGKAETAIMILAAIAQEEGYQRVPDIADDIGMSVSYVEQVVAGLLKAGIVRSMRGPGGGYVLAREASAITAAEVIRLFETKSDRAKRERSPVLDDFYGYLEKQSVQYTVDRMRDAQHFATLPASSNNSQQLRKTA